MVIEQGDPMPNIPALRDGRLTPDDTRLPGVTLQLCDGSGVPQTDLQGNPITTKTDANGYYKFTEAASGRVFDREVPPSGYLPGVDTAGSKGGLVVNRYSGARCGYPFTLAVDPSGGGNDADLDQSRRHSSEAWPISATCWLKPALTRPTIRRGGGILSAGATQPPGCPSSRPRRPSNTCPSDRAYFLMPETMKQAIFGGGGVPGGYSWHLSVLDAGHPRRNRPATNSSRSRKIRILIRFPGPATTWTSPWILADKDGVPIKKLRFGMHGATPVTGDWDGSGTTKIGVFMEGLWFLDLNGNGVWDKGDLWVKLGKKGDQPVTGDWNGDGKTDIGIFGPSWIGDTQAMASEPGLP